jgi:hypothetical protein
MKTCIEIAKEMGKQHIVFISNLLLDISELPIEPTIHITYWTITMGHPTIISHPNLTIIEGYDINIYHELQHYHILTRNSYKDIIIDIIRKENIIPILSV